MRADKIPQHHVLTTPDEPAGSELGHDHFFEAEALEEVVARFGMQ